ncbi:isochorismatase family protein [Klugiella xanthotipulae]|uniref:nicotinamidase n=1 Tax=Klugiella xanthotipulae TaxID=244735 RepID=A0A543HYU1_9MICO|nr:isochorismatase family protein [Klugiella xanthotipulae]TQM63523.1 nicotinamidase/pyrazinamidase [Klugiella xanthotipulae]
MAKALLIIDVQNDFAEGGALAVDGGAAVASGITRLMTASVGEYDLVVASRDWHTAGSDNGGHFAVRGEVPNFSTTWPEHCVVGTEGADYHPLLNLEPIDVHLRKGMGVPAYSAFEGVAPDGSTLNEVFAANDITVVDVVGLATDYCVLASARDALAAGQQVRVFTDLVAGVAPATSVAALRELAAAGAVLEEADV